MLLLRVVAPTDILCSICRGFTPENPAWVGAWWLGFVASSIISLILALFMLLLPKELPGILIK